jgi:hypothetical protein
VARSYQFHRSLPHFKAVSAFPVVFVDLESGLEIGDGLIPLA